MAILTEEMRARARPGRGDRRRSLEGGRTTMRCDAYEEAFAVGGADSRGVCGGDRQKALRAVATSKEAKLRRATTETEFSTRLATSTSSRTSASSGASDGT